MNLERFLGSGKKGVFYGVQNNDKITLEKQIQKAGNLANRYNSIIIKNFVDIKNNLLLNDLIATRKGLLDLMKWTVANECDFIICYEEKLLYDDQRGKQKIKIFIAANQVPIIICDKEILFHPFSISNTNLNLPQKGTCE